LYGVVDGNVNDLYMYNRMYDRWGFGCCKKATLV